MRHEVLTQSPSDSQQWLIDVSLSWSSFWRIQHCRQIRHVNTLLSQHKSLIRCKSFNKNPVYTYLVFFNIRIKTPVTVNNIYFMYSTMDETVNSFLVHCCFYSIILGPDTGYEQSSSVEWRLTEKSITTIWFELKMMVGPSSYSVRSAWYF